MANELQKAILDAISQDPPCDAEGDQIEAFITKTVIVVEWIDGKGNRWLTRRTLLGDGSSGTTWDAGGMLHEALHGEWGSQER